MNRCMAVHGNPILLRCLSACWPARVVALNLFSGRNALEWLRLFRPEVLVADLAAPGLGGVEGAGTLRRAGREPEPAAPPGGVIFHSVNASFPRRGGK